MLTPSTLQPELVFSKGKKGSSTVHTMTLEWRICLLTLIFFVSTDAGTTWTKVRSYVARFVMLYSVQSILTAHLQDTKLLRIFRNGCFQKCKPRSRVGLGSRCVFDDMFQTAT
jgi:hypothetical protein